MSKTTLVFGLVILAGLCYALWCTSTISVLKEEKADLEQQVKDLNTSLEEHRAYADKLSLTLAEREVALNKANSDRYKLTKQLAEAKHADPDFKTWADTPVPDTVHGLLNGNNANKDSN